MIGFLSGVGTELGKAGYRSETEVPKPEPETVIILYI